MDETESDLANELGKVKIKMHLCFMVIFIIKSTY